LARNTAQEAPSRGADGVRVGDIVEVRMTTLIVGSRVTLLAVCLVRSRTA
jgi:hypothetical protein